MRSLVFSSLRNNKTLFSFFTSVFSSLHISISAYNGGIKESYTWLELLFHLTNNRNPFLTAQLLPKFIEPENYYHDLYKEDNTAFDGEEAVDATALQRGPVDTDGAPCPTWNTTFQFHFHLPLITSCKVTSKEIAKVKVEGKPTYLVVMIRETKLKTQKDLKFLTLYDPKTATEYQCGLRNPKQVEETDLIWYQKFFQYFQERDPDIIPDKKDFCAAVSEAADSNMLILGPAITPRVVFNVFNSNGKVEELLGACQVSISSVLSGTGYTDPQWITLSYLQDNGDGNTTVVKAGEIQVELAFNKLEDGEDKVKNEKSTSTAPVKGATSIGKKHATEEAKESFADEGPTSGDKSLAENSAAKPIKKKKDDSVVLDLQLQLDAARKDISRLSEVKESMEKDLVALKAAAQDVSTDVLNEATERERKLETEYLALREAHEKLLDDQKRIASQVEEENLVKESEERKKLTETNEKLQRELEELRLKQDSSLK